MRTVFMIDGKRVPDREAVISPLGAGPMFGYGALDRLRGFRGPDGKMRIIGLSRHLDRTWKTTARLFPPVRDLRDAWREWLVSAVRASEIDEPYIHIGFGQYASPGTMLQRAGSGLHTIIFVKEEGPLYGEELHVTSEERFPRPDGPLADHKVHGTYAELLRLKEDARARLPDRDARSVEGLLFSRSSFRSDESGAWTLAEDDPFVAEFGCSNAFSLCDGSLHLPAPHVRCFRGVTIRIAAALFQAYFPLREIRYDLRRSHLAGNGGAAGTAPRDLIPVVEIDETATFVSSQFYELAALYRALCSGTFDNEALQDEWAPTID